MVLSARVWCVCVRVCVCVCVRAWGDTPDGYQLIQSIETNTRVYIIMEEATGGDLLNVIRKQKRVSEHQAGIWLRQLSDGVEYCHLKGVVHRDLKCENLLLDGRVSIVSPYPYLSVCSAMFNLASRTQTKLM